MSLPALLLPPPRMRRRRLRMQLRTMGTALAILQICRAQTANPQTTDCTPPPSICPCGSRAWRRLRLSAHAHARARKRIM